MTVDLRTNLPPKAKLRMEGKVAIGSGQTLGSLLGLLIQQPLHRD